MLESLTHGRCVDPTNRDEHFQYTLAICSAAKHPVLRRLIRTRSRDCPDHRTKRKTQCLTQSARPYPPLARRWKVWGLPGATATGTGSTARVACRDSQSSGGNYSNVKTSRGSLVPSVAWFAPRGSAVAVRELSFGHQRVSELMPAGVVFDAAGHVAAAVGRFETIADLGPPCSLPCTRPTIASTDNCVNGRWVRCGVASPPGRPRRDRPTIVSPDRSRRASPRVGVVGVGRRTSRPAGARVPGATGS
jgi:hypothetical protein